MFQIGKLSVSSLTSTLGTAAIAANAVANTTTTFLNIPANAVGMAALTVVGQCLGAGERTGGVLLPPPDADRLLRRVGDEPVGLLLRQPVRGVPVQPSPEAEAMALDIMVWFNIVSLFVWPSSFTLPNILRRRRCPVYHDREHRVHVDVPVGFCYLAVLWRRGGAAGDLDGVFLCAGVPVAVSLAARPARRLGEQSVI